MEWILHLDWESSENYKPILSKDGIQIEKKTTPNCPVLLIRFFLVLDYEPKTVFDLIYNLELRWKWDKVFH